MSIKIKLTGGLGNQMFQFATGYTLAKKRNLNLFLDLSWFKKRKLHNGFELKQVFDIFSKVNFLYDDFNFKSFKIKELLNKLDFTYHTFNEPHFNYSAEINNLPNHSYLKGYWQSEIYFNECRNEIKKIFSFNHDFDNLNSKIADEIFNTNSVSLHIRRGDFLLKKNEIHNTNLKNFYSKAIQEISKFYFNKKFFIFTDDPIWVSKNFNINEDYLVINNNLGQKSFIDMYLMSLCKTNIIANSSFSWWAAWLNNNNNKKVFAPKNWFNDKSICTDSLIPGTWNLI